jgi:hypothetical protein
MRGRDIASRLTTTTYARGVGIVSVVGAAILTLAAIAALAVLGAKVTDDWRAFPQYVSPRWLVVVAVVLSAAVAGLVAMLRLPSHRLAVGLAIAAGLRVATALLVDGPTTGDWAQYHAIAARIAQGADPWSNIPTGYSMFLAIPYAVLGPQPWLGELLNIGLGVVTAWLVYRLTQLAFGELAAGAAIYLFAIAPDQVLMTAVHATEPLYTMLVMVAATMLFVPRIATAVVAGLALGVSQYVRPTTLLISPVFVAILPLIDRWRPRLVVFGAFIVIALLPVIQHNAEAYGEWSVSTSRRGAWSLLVGTNQRYSGAFNASDVPSDQVWTAEAAAIAQAEAIRRITSDPAGFGALAVRKVFSFTASGDYAIWIALPDASQTARSSLALISQAIYAAILTLAMLAAWRVRREPVAVFSLGILAILTVAHMFLEVSPRYHATLVPLFCVLAGVQAAHWWTRRVSERFPAAGAPAGQQPAGAPDAGAVPA